jgi:hypothetical protein
MELVGELAEVVRDQRPTRKVSACVYRHGIRLADLRTPTRAGFNNVFETSFGLVQTPDRTKANVRAFRWDKIKDWLLHGAIEADEKVAADLAGPGYHINRSNLQVLESKAAEARPGEPGRRRCAGADVRAARDAGGG